MRGGSLGHFYNTDKEEEFLKLRSQIRGDIVVCLGARAAEIVFYGENTAGVSMDLIMATHAAASMIGTWGMGKEIGLSKEEDEKAVAVGKYLISLAEAISNPMMGSPVGTILQAYREPVAQILGKAYIDAWRLMYVNRDSIDKMAKILIEKGEIVGDEIDDLLDSEPLQRARIKLFPPDIPKIEKKDGTLANIRSN